MQGLTARSRKRLDNVDHILLLIHSLQSILPG
jgi:hypothetical protein